VAVIAKLEIDDELLDRLEALARDQKVPIEKQIVSVLRAHVPVANRLQQLADEVAAMTPKGIQQTDSTRLIREDRDQ
jgi:antitoxin FitA